MSDISVWFKLQTKDSDIFVCKEKPDNGGETEEEYPLFGLVDQVRSNPSPWKLMTTKVT